MLKTSELILIDNMTYNRYNNGKIYSITILQHNPETTKLETIHVTAEGFFLEAQGREAQGGAGAAAGLDSPAGGRCVGTVLQLRNKCNSFC